MYRMPNDGTASGGRAFYIPIASSGEVKGISSFLAVSSSVSLPP